MVARSRLAEDTLAEGRAEGVGRYVILGAGLDGFALRNPFDDVTVFEVDTPESQAWKLDRLDQLGIEVPDHGRHVACDFETRDFAELLIDAGFDATAPSVAAWLGVSYYLTAEAMRVALGCVGSWAPGSAIVFDYALADDHWDRFEDFDAESMRATMRGLAAVGEPFLSFSTTTNWWNSADRVGSTTSSCSATTTCVPATCPAGPDACRGPARS